MMPDRWQRAHHLFVVSRRKQTDNRHHLDCNKDNQGTRILLNYRKVEGYSASRSSFLTVCHSTYTGTKKLTFFNLPPIGYHHFKASLSLT